jgi:hypothetical protein
VINARTTFKPISAHLGEVALGSIAPAEEMSLLVRTERAVGHALDEEFAVAFEEKFRRGANRTRESRSHSGASID